MTLKELVYKILLENKETRDSDKKLIWEVWTQLKIISSSPLTDESYIYKSDFMSAPSNESVRRVRQQLQRGDLLTGTKLIQPTETIKKQRVKLSKEKGYSFIQGKQWVFNPETQSYEEQ